MNEVYIVCVFPAAGRGWGSTYTDQPLAVQEYHRQIQNNYNGYTIILVGVSLAGVKELLRYEPRQ